MTKFVFSFVVVVDMSVYLHSSPKTDINLRAMKSRTELTMRADVDLTVNADERFANS